MRWLLLKDLQIMRRSPLLTALLIVYPIVIAVLIGFALSRGPDKPRVAFLNQVPTDTPFEIGGEELRPRRRPQRALLADRVRPGRDRGGGPRAGRVRRGARRADPARRPDRGPAVARRPDAARSPTVQVLVNEEDPVKGEPRRRPDQLAALGGEPADLPEGLRGLGQLPADPARRRRLLVPRRRPRRARPARLRGDPAARPRRAAAEQPGGRRPRRGDPLQPSLAAENLGVADDLLGSVSQPIGVEKEVVSGDAPSLDTFAISVAATITLMFVTVLLVAGSLALEREENAFARLTRGLVGKSALLAEKVLLGVAVALVVTLLMLAGLSLFVDLDWGRFLLWIPAIVAGGAGLRRLRRGDRRRRPRGPRRLAARLHDQPAGRLPLARPLGHGRARALRRDQRRHRALPVRPGAAGALGRARLGRAEHRDRDPPPGAARRSPTARSPGSRSGASPSDRLGSPRDQQR